MQLPDSELYEFMSGSFLKPEITLSRLIKMTENDETEKINKTVARNRFRVPTGPKSMIGGGTSGGGGGDVAQYDILNKSTLPKLYQDLMNISNDDELRRQIEVKLLKHRYQLLRLSRNKEEKDVLQLEVEELASGMVIVDCPDPIAWRLTIDWKDVKEFRDLDLGVVTSFIEKFPREGLAKVLDGFLHSEISPFTAVQIKVVSEGNGNNSKKDSKKPTRDKGKGKIRIAKRDDPEMAKLLEKEGVDIVDEEMDLEQEKPEETVWKPSEVLEVLSEGFTSDQESILCYRILGAFYLRIQEYETAVDIAQRGLEAIKKVQISTHTQLPNGKDHLSLILGTAYIYYQAPKNYDIAIKVFDFVLKRDPINVEANIGKGLILREKRQFKPALKLLKTVIEQSPDNFQAVFEYSWCRVLTGNREEGRKGLEKCLTMITGNDPLSVDYRAKIWWRIGSSKWEYNRDKTEAVTQTSTDNGSLAQEAFNAFVQSLQENPNYAPAYTSLGYFYSQVLGDSGRSSKCFYKAFEIDGGELDAAYQLANEFADKGEWDLVQVVANRVVESDRLRTYSGREASWPYRALGIVGLNQRDFSKSVQYFQKSLRIAPKDSNAWLGLGEAYANSGRYVAASKAYERAKLLDPENIAIQYQYALVLREMQQFDKALFELREIQAQNVTEFPVGSALLETYILSAKNFLENDFYGDAIESASGAILVVSQEQSILREKRSALSSFLWKGVGDACEIFLTVESKIDSIPLKELCVLFEEEIDDSADIRSTIITFMVKSLELSAKTAPPSAKGLAAYNLGLAHFKAYNYGLDDSHLEECISSFKIAIQSEPRNYEFWNAYGIASHSINARVSQHCFIRSLGLSPRQPRTWTNLALLYMANGDLELASEAIDKAHAVDPDFVVSWICQAVIDATLGNIKNARNLFEHSNTISKGTDGLAKFLYGLSVLEYSQSSEVLSKSSGSIELDTGILALQKYLMLSPKSYLGLTIQGMLLERTASYVDGIKNLEKLCAKLESDYEKSESDNDLVKFAKAKSQLARLRLGAHQFTEAIEDAQVVLSLLNDAAEHSKILLACSLVAGIGLYFSDQFGDAIEHFKAALEVSGEDQDVVILLVQVLWANGGENEREVALEQVYSSIGNKGSSVKMTLLLGVIGLLKDPELLDAAGEELEGLGLDDLMKDGDNSVQEVLSMIQKSDAPWKKAMFMWPSEYGILKNINFQTALKTAESHNSRRTVRSIEASELNQAYIKADGSIQSAQRAIFYSPWKNSGWQGLEAALIKS